MAMHGGRTPWDEAGALAGPARVLYAPTSVAVPGDLWDIVPAVATAGGEYPAKTGWVDFGLMADPPSVTHGRDSSGLDYQQPSGPLFQAITEVNRSMTVNIAHIDEVTMQIVENAAAATSIAAATGESALKKVYVGLYSNVPQWRIALVSFRPSGAGAVVEPAPSPIGTRPPAVARVIPRATISSDDTEIEFPEGDPAAGDVTFTAESEPTAPAGGEHGYWIFEQAGTIA